ncbi:WhiB family transcriptional regulator [Streptomyces sp. YU58]|uniref:WhiB family transcriptional regulator n=1 Tax=Streptomyces sp. SX92 TaxID=3158972 RepID=UPI0027B8AFB6|nr:WhiB family transcriptional regulator [Streptomyces coralus]WLW57278.1 WhiB family transcriptional regulator [Streptomyces coralus]
MGNTLRPLQTDWQWQQRAACRGMSSSVFFSPPGERGRARRVREERARAVCGRCEVVDVCAAMALKQGESYGVWGGLSDEERRRIGTEATGRAEPQDAPSR